MRLTFTLLLLLSFSIELVKALETSNVDNVIGSSRKHIKATEETQTALHAAAKSKATDSYILFTARSDSFLFINGQLKGRVRGWDNVGHVYHALKVGDVVSIYARGKSRSKSGLIATVYRNKQHVSTGEAQWKAIGLSRKVWKYVRHWRSNKGSSCQWPLPITRPLRKSYTKELQEFPASAQVVWATGADRRNAVLFRYVVGGEKCTSHLGRITFSATDAAWLYVDGRFRGWVSHWNQVRRVHVRLTKGSVVALKVRNNGGWHGVIAEVALSTGEHIVTGQPVWKAVRGHIREYRNPLKWRTRRYSSCHWPTAVTLPRQNQHGVTKKSPFKNGARYVWADGIADRAVILLRYVVGGEPCRQQTRIYVHSRAKSWIYINGRLAAYVRSGGRRTLYRYLQKGDIIGVLSKGRRRRGVLLVMQGPLGYVYSGGPGWVGRMGSRPCGWARKSYSSCNWRPAVVVRNIRDKYARQGAMIWGSRRRRGVSVVRYVMGGEDCSSIKYESKGRVQLYVNSQLTHAQRIGHRTWAAKTALKKGDVVGILGYVGRGEGKGALRAVVTVKGKHYSTGKTGWRVARLPRNSSWKQKGFDACSWGSGKVVGGWKRLGDAPVPARALWANGVATALRFVVGGDSCKTPFQPQQPQPQGALKKAEVTLTGDNEVTLFLNGKSVLSTRSWRSVAKAVVEVKTGDVFAVHAKDGGLWFGIRVGLVVDGKEMGTGVGDWRARGATGVGEAWKKAGFDGCSWAKVAKAADVDDLFENGAPSFAGTSTYVWATRRSGSGSGSGEDIIARLVLGRSC